jgi:hypothetical protein
MAPLVLAANNNQIRQQAPSRGNGQIGEDYRIKTTEFSGGPAPRLAHRGVLAVDGSGRLVVEVEKRRPS